MILDYEPGDKVINPKNKDWGIGQVQSIIKEKVTVNFENVGKKVINANLIELINEFKSFEEYKSNKILVYILLASISFVFSYNSIHLFAF